MPPEMTISLATELGIDIGPAIDGFRTAPHLILLRVVPAKTRGDLFRRPVFAQFLGHIIDQWLMRLPAMMPGFDSAAYRRLVSLKATVKTARTHISTNFSADRRVMPTEKLSQLPATQISQEQEFEEKAFL